jgi:uncharacterized protein YjbI with pentapeptide repeats
VANLAESENGLSQNAKGFEGDPLTWLMGGNVAPRTRVTAFGLVVVLAGAFIGVLLGRGIHDLFLGDDDGVYKILVTLAGAIGAPFVAWRTIIAHQQTAIAHQQAGIAREIHLTSLFTRAVEQLGAMRDVSMSPTAAGATPVMSGSAIHSAVEPNLEVRLSAIYALERIAQDSERDHWPIMEVLCHYVRNPQNCGAPKQKPRGEDVSRKVSWTQSIHPRADIQAAISAIGRRPPESTRNIPAPGYRLDLTGANLQGVVIEGNFSIADFSGSFLAGAEIRNCTLPVTGLRDVTEVDGLTISSSTISGFGAFRLCTNLVGVRFLNCTFKNFAFKGRMVNAVFEECSLIRASFRGATLKKARFENCDLFESDFSNVEFSSGKLLGCNLRNAIVAGVDLSHVKLDDAIKEARGDDSTELPMDVDRPESWRRRDRHRAV